MTETSNPEAQAAPPGPPGEPTLADRLAEVCIDLRGDLEVSRHVFRGEAHYVLRDPISFSSHSFALADYRILTALGSGKTLGVVFEGLVESGELQEEDSERFFEFIFSLHKLGFLALPISDEKSLYKRYEARKAAKRASAAKSILFFRIPLVDPDQFLDRTMPYIRPLFSRAAFAVWGLTMAVALWVVTRNWTEFIAPVGNIFSSDNLPILWITLITLKVFHEFGHAYATKAFGGRVPEMGLFFMIFTPCAYVDASAAWGFSKKRERIFVCLAGMYVELFIAALCLMAWSVMPPGFWRSVLHNATMLASVITIGFNINPLMRYDGYYALSDAVEIPNLRSRAQDYGISILKRLTLGIRSPKLDMGLGVRSFLLSFGIAGGIYKVTLVLGISATIAMKFPVLGMAMGGTYFLNEIYGIAKRTLPYLWRAEETASVRGWAMALSMLVLGGLPMALFSIPVPSSVVTRGVIGTHEEVILRAQAAGFVHSLEATPGAELSGGQVVMQLSDPGAHTRLDEVRARLASARYSLSRSLETTPASAAKEVEMVAHLEQEVLAREADLEKLTVSAPCDGHLIHALDRGQVGQFIQRGGLVGTVASGAPVVRALLTEEDIAATQPKEGEVIEFRSASNPGRILRGRIIRVAPAGSREFNQSFARFLDPADYSVNVATGMSNRNQFEVEAILEPNDQGSVLRDGMTGHLRLMGEPESIGIRFLRKTQTFIRQLTS